MRRALALLVVGLGLAGCGLTTIVTNDKDARIYADGRYLGKGEARYTGRTGFPRSMKVTVKTPSAKVERVVKREFTATTAVLGMITYATGWLWAWQYPETVMVVLPQGAKAEGSGWDEAPSPWDAPPGSWDAGDPAAGPAGAK